MYRHGEYNCVIYCTRAYHVKLLNVCNVYSVYDVKVVKLMLLWFIAGILCETCKVSDVFQAYHMNDEIQLLL